MNATPFLSLSRALELPPQRALETRPEHPAPKPAPGAALSVTSLSRAQSVYEAALSAVQKQLDHLSREEIQFAAPDMPDAEFARQVAVHLSIRHLGAPLKLLSRELPRSTESLHRALRAVDARLERGHFSQAYAAMAADADEYQRGALSEGVRLHG